MMLGIVQGYHSTTGPREDGAPVRVRVRVSACLVCESVGACQCVCYTSSHANPIRRRSAESITKIMAEASVCADACISDWIDG